MPTSTKATGAHSFSASADRARSARAFVYWVMPAVLALVTALTLVELVTGELPPEIMLAAAAFWTVQGVCIVLVRRGADPSKVAGAILVTSGIIELLALYGSPDPNGGSASLAFFVVAAAYFLSTRTAIAYTIATTIGITVASHTVDDWGDSFWIPSTAFVVFITGLLTAFIMGRVRRTESALERVASEQAESLERLEQVDRARDRLIANVSHELRTPLTSTIGSVETLMRTDVELEPAQRDRLLEIARDGGRRLLALVEDLLTVGTTRPDSLELAPEPEQLASLVHDAVVGIDPGDGRVLRLELDVDAAVRVDRMRMLQVVTNLVVNAVRHGAGGIVVSTDVDAEHALIRVIDEGPGVAPEHLDELFLPFARFSTRTDSTGLGLAICRALVEAHGGQITYARTGDERTCFTVTLPLDPDRDASS